MVAEVDRWVRRPVGISVSRALRSTTRASIHEHLQRVGEGQTVRDVADRFDLHPNVARTHLETLADAGLVVVGSRKHPGGGRPAKVYLARPDAGDDEVRLDEPVSSAGPGRVIRLLGEVIANGQGAQVGRLEALRQAALAEGRRIIETRGRSGASLREAAAIVARAARADGYEVSIQRTKDDVVALSRVGGVLLPLHGVRGGVCAALEAGLLSGAFTAAWRPVQVVPAAGDPGWLVRPAAGSAGQNRLLVEAAASVDARGFQRETGVVRAMRAITGLNAGAVLEVLAEGPGSPAAFARWADRAGHQLLGVERATDGQGRPAIRLLIRKGR